MRSEGLPFPAFPGRLVKGWAAVLLRLVLGMAMVFTATSECIGVTPKQAVSESNTQGTDQTCVPIGCVLPGIKTLDQVKAAAANSVAVVQYGSRLGSGVVISRKGYLVTAAHLVEDAQDVFVLLPHQPATTGKVLLMDEGSDLALIRLTKPTSSCLPLATGLPKLNSQLFVIGYPRQKHLERITLDTHLVEFRSVGDGRVFLATDLDLDEGFSGAPIINNEGQVVGIISWKLTRTHRMPLSFGASSLDAIRLLRLQPAEK